MTITEFRDILVNVNPKVKIFHGIATNQTGNYLCWERVGTVRLPANDNTISRVQKIKLYFFTKEEYPQYPVKLEEELLNHTDLTVSDLKEECDYDYGVYCYMLDVQMVVT